MAEPPSKCAADMDEGAHEISYNKSEAMPAWTDDPSNQTAPELTISKRTGLTQQTATSPSNPGAFRNYKWSLRNCRYCPLTCPPTCRCGASLTCTNILTQLLVIPSRRTGARRPLKPPTGWCWRTFSGTGAGRGGLPTCLAPWLGSASECGASTACSALSGRGIQPIS